MKKSTIMILISVIDICLIIALICLLYISDSKIINNNGKINLAVNVNRESIEDLFEEKEINIKDGKKTYECKLKDYGYQLTLTDDSYKDVINKFYINMNSIKTTYKFNEVEKDFSFINEGKGEEIKPILYFEDNVLEIKNNTIDNYVDVESLCVGVLDNINNGIYEIDASKYYMTKEIENELTQEIKNEIDKINNFQFKYTDGYILSGMDLLDYIYVENNKIYFNEELESDCFKFIDKQLERNILDYDTVGGTWNFKTTSGNSINVSGGTYGDYFSSDEEAKYIVEKFKKFEGEDNREPIKTQDFPNEIPNTYVEVSLNDQHMWFYKDGELLLDSDIVTGNKGTHNTPKGVYYISEKVKGKYLTGADYRTWVNRWMRLTNRGHGLHDAYWRSSFGGNIYTYDGSHGCVNLPKDIAYKLYDLVNVNDCVVIY